MTPDDDATFMLLDALRTVYSGLLADHGVDDTRRRLATLGLTARAEDPLVPSPSPRRGITPEHVDQCLREHAAIALRLAQLRENERRHRDGTRDVIASRMAIEQAKGMLMERHGCTADAAFAMLVWQSQQQNRKVRLIASDIVGDAEAPEDGEPVGGDGGR